MHYILFTLELKFLIQSGHKMSCVQQTQNSIKSRFSRSPLEGREMTMSMFVWIEGDSNFRSIRLYYRKYC